MFSTCKNKGVYKVNMESGAECLLNVNLTPEGIEQKKATFRYQTTAKHKAGKFTTLNEPVIRATFHYPVFMLHIYVHVKVLGTVCH